MPEEAMNNFTPRAQQVLALARKEADRFNHNFVGTEHLLLGLIKLGQGVAVNVLQKLGLDLETVRMEVEKQVGTGPDQKMIGNIPYTPRVKKVLALAAKEAKALNHTYVGTEHILLGLVKEGSGVGANVLKNLGVDLRKVRLGVEKLVKSGPDPVAPGELYQTPRAKKVIEYAIEEARALNHNYVGTEHILLGLLRESEGIAAQVLMNLGLKLEDVRQEVLNLLGAGVDGGHDQRPEVVALARLVSSDPTRIRQLQLPLSADHARMG
jgi:ATP-dependent Clp protease ATP-binding subunit ClpA